MRAFGYLVGAGLLLAALVMSRRADASELPAAKVAQDVEGKPVPRGIRNNNPGNLRPGDDWRGRTGVDEQHYLIFDTAEHGIRAMTINLIHQTTKHRLDTVREIIAKWAPLSENPEQPAYVANVARALGVSPDDQLDLVRNAGQVEAFVRAVIRQENGLQPYGAETIVAGVRAGMADA